MNRLLIAAPLAFLLLTGFGCRALPSPATNQSYQQAQTAEWLVEPPQFSYSRGADIATGRVTLTVHTKPQASVNVVLTGPNAIDGADQTKDVDADGIARFSWDVNRLGQYHYAGAIRFSNNIVARFEDDGYAQ